MLCIATATHFGATLFFIFIFFGTIFVMGLSFGRRNEEMKKNKKKRYSTMHKAKINFREVEGLKKTSFSFEDHLTSESKLRLSATSNPIKHLIALILKSLYVHKFNITQIRSFLIHLYRSAVGAQLVSPLKSPAERQTAFFCPSVHIRPLLSVCLVFLSSQVASSRSQ